jgi:DNA-directed RNA polymerase subunit RPC12/RpoP
MRTHSRTDEMLAENRQTKPRFAWILPVLWLGVSLVSLTACKKDPAFEAMDSDANGYMCLKCGAKLYTERSTFIGPKCPKCNEDTLIEVVGYYCQKDQYLTIRARRGDPQGPVCDKCQAPLVNAMKTQREKELKAWGATKFQL